MLSQARGNGVYVNFSEDTFPAVRTGTGGHLPLLRVPEGLPEHGQPEEITRTTIDCFRGPAARPERWQDRATGVANAVTRGAPANVTLPGVA